MENATERVTLASPELIRELEDWSTPVQIKVIRVGSGRYATHEMVARVPMVTDEMVAIVLGQISMVDGVNGYRTMEERVRLGLERMFAGGNTGDLDG